MEFKTNNTFEKRCDESNKIMKKYPNRVPIIVEKSKNSTLTNISKNKYLAPRDLMMNEFIYTIRRNIKLDKSESIFVMVGSRVSPSNVNLGEVYEENKDEDGFLYVTYTSENTFG
tara:strand:+ start:115 stop:459 length:345 start_codon:yes stop_codon:yes gene_type:complete